MTPPLQCSEVAAKISLLFYANTKEKLDILRKGIVIKIILVRNSWKKKRNYCNQ